MRAYLRRRFSNVHWYVKREYGFMRPFGLGAYTSGGCLGSTYCEEGLDMTREVVVLIGPWKWALRIAWKDLR
jgi:hypothetical protein